MIQRIQTVWLLVVAIINAMWFFLFTSDNSVLLYASKIGGGLVAVLAVITIFLYRKRTLQINLCYGIFVVALALIIILAWGHNWECLLYLSSLLFDGLAIHAINKDEKLVRSTDRLR